MGDSSVLPRGAAASHRQSRGNALDAMPAGGRLILRTRKFMNRHTGKLCVRLTVADTGVGMNSEVLSRGLRGLLHDQRSLRDWAWTLAESGDHEKVWFVVAGEESRRMRHCLSALA